jgi:hypothetical protein
MAQGLGPEFKPWYHTKKKKKRPGHFPVHLSLEKWVNYSVLVLRTALLLKCWTLSSQPAQGILHNNFLSY